MGATWSRWVGAVAVAAVALALVPAGDVEADAEPASFAPGTVEAASAAARRPARLELPPRHEVARDRYELAGGCYAVRSIELDRYLTNTGPHYLASAEDRADAEPFHLQATDLGSYLLVTPELRYLGVPRGLLGDVAKGFTDEPGGAAIDGLTRGIVSELLDELAAGPLGDLTGRGDWINSVASPSLLTDWVVEEGEGGFTLTLPELGRGLRVSPEGELWQVPAGEADRSGTFAFERTEGCVAWPEVELNVEGATVGGETPYGPTRGYLDAHLHGMAFEFLGGRARCGRPWSPYGAPDALRGCPEHDLLGGRTHLLETVLSGRDPVAGHDTTGWPTFRDWPAHFSLTYEQTYYRWIERAYRGGLRLYVNLLVDNNKLCTVYPFNRNSCNEMDGVRLQAEQLRAFERYIDAQHGGPGRGWLRIVEDPFEARRVINEGKLAVVMGIEVSVLFDCGIVAGQPQCDEGDIDRQLDEVHALGVRQMELVNKFDSALGGVAGDSGTTGVLVNGANFLETGSFWRMGECPGEEDHADRTFPNVPDELGLPDELGARDALFGVILDTVGTSGLAPVYAGGPHCNQMGLTDLGEHTIRGMMDRGMLFDPDHLSAIARDEAMTVIEEAGYSGVVSSHSWSDAGIYERIHAMGGVVTPMAGSSEGFVREWLANRAWADDRFPFGIGFGSDINGFASQGPPREPAEGEGVSYPFEGFGGVTVDRQVSGERVFDINVDGVAHYGLYPDWIEDLRVLAGDAIVEDLERGPEAYLQMWERAVGVAPDSCRADVTDLDEAVLASVQPGMAAEEVLLAVGQPRARDGAGFTYCLERGRTAEVAFDADGQVLEVRAERSRVPAAVAPAEVTPAEVASVEATLEGIEAQPSFHLHGDVVHWETPGTLVADAAGATPEDRSTAIQLALLLLGVSLVAVRKTSATASRRRTDTV
ncbi:peptidase [Nitriliruptoraceae bacterium ZYF776]|nr:peptidase [Profundirhabdus halotolerans]